MAEWWIDACLPFGNAGYCAAYDAPWSTSGHRLYDDTRLWSADRLHLSPLGHRLTAEAVMDALGLGGDAWRSPMSDPPRPGWSRRRGSDAAWFLAHAGPWITRRIRGVSSGAGVVAKDPTYRTVHKAGASLPPLPQRLL